MQADFGHCCSSVECTEKLLAAQVDGGLQQRRPAHMLRPLEIAAAQGELSRPLDPKHQKLPS